MQTTKIFAWISWIVISVFYSYQYILRVMPNIMLNDIMQQFDMNTTIFGQFSGIYYIGYSLMHIPIGLCLDRYGAKKVVPFCIILMQLGLLPLIYSNNYIYPIIGRGLIGIGSSAAILGVFKIVRLTFDEKLFPRMLSFSVTIGLLGAIYGGGPLNYINNMFGHIIVIKMLMGFGLLLALVSYLILPKPTYQSNETILSNLRQVLTNKKVVMVCILAGMMIGPLEGFADVWAAEFLKQVYNINDSQASYLPSLLFMGMCFGSPVLSIIAEKSGSYLRVIIGAGVVMLIIFLALLCKLLTITTIGIGFIIVGICCAYQILAIYQVSTYVNENIVGLTTAVANMIIMIFGYGFHSIIGLIINKYSIINLSSAFIYGISIIPVALIIAIAGFCMVYLSDTKKTEKSI